MFNKDLNKLIRSSRLQMFFRICVLQDFAIFTGKNLRWSLFLITLDALLKRDSNTGVFLLNLRLFQERLFYRTPLDVAT